jgi:hypothetical protein
MFISSDIIICVTSLHTTKILLMLLIVRIIAPVVLKLLNNQKLCHTTPEMILSQNVLLCTPCSSNNALNNTELKYKDIDILGLATNGQGRSHPKN